MDNLQEFIDKEIAKKEAKEKTKLDRALENVDVGMIEVGTSAPTKKSWEQDIKDGTKIHESAEELLRYYFNREKVIMEKLFGVDWKRHVKNPDWPRERYTAIVEKKKHRKKHENSSDSSASDNEEKRQRDKRSKSERMKAAQAKAKGYITFLTMGDR